MNTGSLVFRLATSSGDFEDGKILFKKYAATLTFDLEFQGFAEELATIDKRYGDPDGALVLCYVDKQPAGCVAVKKLSEGIAELKRLFVDPGFRAAGIGASLMHIALEQAKKLGYDLIRLDTVAEMQSAIKLYKRLGFYTIEAYCYNPLPTAVYMEKRF